MASWMSLQPKMFPRWDSEAIVATLATCYCEGLKRGSPCRSIPTISVLSLGFPGLKVWSLSLYIYIYIYGNRTRIILPCSGPKRSTPCVRPQKGPFFGTQFCVPKLAFFGCLLCPKTSLPPVTASKLYKMCSKPRFLKGFRAIASL